MKRSRHTTPRSRPIARLIAIVVGCLVTFQAYPVVPASGAGPTVDLVCVASAQYNFSPPLNFNTTSAFASGLLSTCVSPSDNHVHLKSGVVFNSVPLIATGCFPVPVTITGGPTTLLWSDGSTSTFNVAVSTNPASGQPGSTESSRPAPWPKIRLSPYR